MGILWWLVLGLVVGVLAKWIMPGKDPGGCVITTLLGIAGALVGGYLSTVFGVGEFTGFNLPSILIALAGAVLLLLIYRLVIGKKE